MVSVYDVTGFAFSLMRSIRLISVLDLMDSEVHF